MTYQASYSEVRSRLKGYLDKVCSEHIPLLVKRKKGENVVVISEDDFRSLEETAYLSRSPKNLQRLLEALGRKDGVSLEEVESKLGHHS